MIAVITEERLGLVVAAQSQTAESKGNANSAGTISAWSGNDRWPAAANAAVIRCALFVPRTGRITTTGRRSVSLPRSGGSVAYLVSAALPAYVFGPARDSAH